MPLFNFLIKNVVRKNLIHPILLSIFCGSTFAKSDFPSTDYSWTLPGYQADIYDDLGHELLGKQELINWELQNADSAFGGVYDAEARKKITSVGYMYTQKIDFSPTDIEFGLREYAKNSGEDYEDYLLHFAEDSVVLGTYAHHSKYTPFNRRPWITGWTTDEQHSGYIVWQRPPFELKPWQYSEQGGCVYVYMPEKFDRVEFTLKTVAKTGHLQVQYPSAIDAETGVVSQWSVINQDIMDGTNGLRISGTVDWRPPSDWIPATTYNTLTNSGHSFGNQYLKAGKKAYIIKACRINEDYSDQPIVTDIQTKDWMPYLNNVNQKRLIYGWDNRNDINGDGYVDSVEFANRINVKASARFEYESRVVPLGNMWNEGSNFQRPNFLNDNYKKAIAYVMTEKWQKEGLLGAYNDDAFKLSDINIIIGGTLQEGGEFIDSPEYKEKYQKAFIKTIGEIKDLAKSEWVSANISAENLFLRLNDRMSYINAFSTFLREDYFRPGLGFAGYFGIAMIWDTFALAKENKNVVILSHAGWRGNIPFENTQQSWESSITTGLAMYYLANVPGATSYTSWNKGYSYGSMNTTDYNFYKAGVPKTIAYQPTSMLKIDIGIPASSIQNWQGNIPAPLPYLAKTSESGYTVIGDSTSTVLTHADIATFEQSGTVPVVPSYLYYAWQSENTIAAGSARYPEQMILARDYTDGLVLYHLDFFGASADFMNVSHEIELPGYYQRVNYDGSLEVASNTITLTGYEGVVLKKVSAQP
jgi:hypothetical protein